MKRSTLINLKFTFCHCQNQNGTFFLVQSADALSSVAVWTKTNQTTKKLVKKSSLSNILIDRGRLFYDVNLKFNGTMDYVRDGEIQGRSLVYLKNHCPCILPSMT